MSILRRQVDGRCFNLDANLPYELRRSWVYLDVADNAAEPGS